MINNVLKKIKGFTLIETMVAVLILATAIAGPLTIASKGLSSALIAKDQIGAFYLAQDAMEYVRFLRDTSCLQQSAGTQGCSTWLSTLLPCVSADGTQTCALDSFGNPADGVSGHASVVQCTSNVCTPLYYNGATHYFTYNSSNATLSLYTRTVSIQNPAFGSNDESVVTVKVVWRDVGGVLRSVVVRENLFNWQ
ncbi:MAG: prepilin-type N-terminal cleavage/methylation domain-containing protein [Patescibacteria group bacterium]|nr:prepilin-type N-terminal cleavage/methylation domain-containing protein [Patescibacteria group bacterium]